MARPTTYTDPKRLRQMACSDLATEREYVRAELESVGQQANDEGGWYVKALDEWAKALDSEILRRNGELTWPAGGAPIALEPEYVQRVKLSTDILAVFEDHGVQLKKRGQQWKGLCPFHDDHNPSLSVRDDGVWHCFACQASGDVITFLMRQGSTFPQAVGELAERAGMAFLESVTSVSSTLPPTLGRAVGGKVGLREVLASEVRSSVTEGNSALEYLPFLGQESYIVQGWSHLVAGYPKAGKTELVVRLCHEWQDESILYFTEEPQSIWQARLCQLPDGWSHVRLVFALGAETPEILGRIKQGSESIVVIDTVRNLLAIRDETDNSEVARVLNPFVAACREGNKTLLMAHHVRKGGGQHGEGITGRHAFLGVVDVGLELLRDGGNASQRTVRGWSRVISIPETMYQLTDDGRFEVLGSPADVAIQAVKDRVVGVLDEGWQTLTAVHQALTQPRPSKEQVRLALNELAEDGQIERDPPSSESQPARTYRYLTLTSPPTNHV